MNIIKYIFSEKYRTLMFFKRLHVKYNYAINSRDYAFIIDNCLTHGLCLSMKNAWGYKSKYESILYRYKPEDVFLEQYWFPILWWINYVDVEPHYVQTCLLPRLNILSLIIKDLS